MSTASLFHRPRSLISSRDIPIAAADTAAPLCRECPEYPVVAMPARRSNSLTLSTKYCLLKGPTVRENRGWAWSRRAVGTGNKDCGVRRQDKVGMSTEQVESRHRV